MKFGAVLVIGVADAVAEAFEDDLHGVEVIRVDFAFFAGFVFSGFGRAFEGEGDLAAGVAETEEAAGVAESGFRGVEDEVTFVDARVKNFEAQGGELGSGVDGVGEAEFDFGFSDLSFWASGFWDHALV